IALTPPLEGPTRLAQEAVGFALRGDADRVEDRQRRRQQRLADVVAREALALEQRHGYAGVGEERGRHRSGRPTADHDDIGTGRHRALALRCERRAVNLERSRYGVTDALSAWVRRESAGTSPSRSSSGITRRPRAASAGTSWRTTRPACARSTQRSADTWSSRF